MSLDSKTWQADFTHHRLADGTDIEILTWLDDHDDCQTSHLTLSA